jgi:hypothetical protein
LNPQENIRGPQILVKLECKSHSQAVVSAAAHGSLLRESTGWYINKKPAASTPIEVSFNSLYSFTQNEPKKVSLEQSS